MKIPFRALFATAIGAALLASALAAGTPAPAATPRSATYQTYTAPNGVSGKYHIYAKSIDFSKPVGVLFVFHGDYSRPAQSYIHQPSGSVMTKMAAEAAQKNMITVPVITPDTKGGITWWEDRNRNGDYFRSLAAMLISKYKLDARRIWFHGYSGGAEFITFEVLADRQGWIKGGGATIVGGGGYVGMQTEPPAAVKRMKLHWIAGSRDGKGGTTLKTWSALGTAQRAQKVYQGLGFASTKMTVLPGITHYTYDMPALLANDLKAMPAAVAAPQARAGDVAAVAPDGRLYIYPSARGRDLYKRTYVSAGWGTALTVEIADWNLDGLQDLVANWKDGRLTVDYGQKRGGFKRSTLGSRGWQNNAIIVTRWKAADRHPGIVVRNRDGKLYSYANRTGGKPDPRQRFSSSNWKGKALMALDFDQDGKMDLIARTSAGQLKLYRSNGTGRLIRESRKVVAKSGWNNMTHLSAAEGHLAPGAPGFLARDKKGNLHFYPVSSKKVQQRITVGVGGWDSLKIGS
ncbi:VCBS repeat-containing protein [Arthrobacter sp. I2-34]|uniref:VCBS repeat-containing protein n=1 Tax=Arthrobacter hankyongi TaxID=2904801 RepID=A0ABS9LB69_9MICC|nr:VCBS repeat-containing protein [Arthrobacter hankyongi]MCG2623707.1 VCBS repeat-containing protein [Arthrobacter hankyongi]